MRIITGSARGRRISTLPGSNTRPTSERVKEAIFSILQFELEGRRILDLFAGSGQMGLEALSRGATRAVFVDSNTAAATIIKTNIEQTGFDAVSSVAVRDYGDYLNGTTEQFDIAFLDPPYELHGLSRALSLTAPRMSAHGVMVCEHRREEELPEQIEGFKRVRQYRYGQTAVSLYRRGADDT